MTHPDVTNPQLRSIFANELVVLRKSMKQVRVDMRSEWVNGIRLGLETFARRMNYVTASSMTVTLFNNERVTAILPVDHTSSNNLPVLLEADNI